MRRWLSIAALTIALVTSGCLPLATPPGAAPLRYRDEIFAAVTKTADLIYGTAVNLSGETVTLRLDRYVPADDPLTSRPAIVWVHGGSFCCGNKTSPELIDQATTFAKKGYVNVSINYRLEPGGCTGSAPGSVCLGAMREALEDAQTAVRFVRANAAAWGVDPGRIAIAGTSAGAITALHVGYSTAEDPSARVRGAVSLSGANFIGPIGKGDAPALLFHGTNDGAVPYVFTENTVDRAEAAGLYAYLTAWEGEGHVPYVAHRTEILDQTSNFLYWVLNLAKAST